MTRLIRICLCAALLACAGACQTLPAVTREENGTFSIRYDPAALPVADVDARAASHCGGPAQFLSQETRFDGFQHRIYRCEGAK